MKKLLRKLKNAYEYIKYDVPQGIKSIIKWFPIIWKDRHWDQSYLYNILEYKLNEMAKLHEKNKRYVDWETNVSRMKLASKLAKLIRENEADDKMHDAFNEKWGESNISFKEPNEKGLYEMILTRDKVKTEEDEKKSKEEFRSMLLEARKLHEKRKKLLFNVLEHNIEKWWE